MKTIKRNNNQIAIIDGDIVTFITRSEIAPHCMVCKGIVTDTGWVVTENDWFGMSQAAAEAKYGITF